MGAIAQSVAEYAQPLIDATDGSVEQVSKMFTLAQVCWNLALLPFDQLEDSIAEMQKTLDMDDGEFEKFRGSVILPMVRRHYEMFPLMHRMKSTSRTAQEPPKQQPRTARETSGNYPKIGRNQPCPCNSGNKYKRCCGR